MEHLCHLKWCPPNSMESNGTRWFSYLATTEFHGIPWNIPCKSRVPWYLTKWQSQSCMEFHGTELYFIWRHQSSMEFHGIFHGIPWNTCVILSGALLIPWNPWNSVIFYLVTPEFHGIPWNIPWKSRVTWSWIEWQSQKSMEFHGTKRYFIWRYQSSMEFHGIFHGIPWNTCVIWNSALLIPWNHLDLGIFFYLSTPGFQGIPWNIPCKSRVTWYWLKWQSQSSMEFHGTKWW